MADELQRALVDLCTRGDLRAAFTAGGVAALGDYALSATETRALGAIPVADLDRYAASLTHKRWRAVAGAVPLTVRIAPGLGARYRTWLAANPAPATPSILDPGAGEALRALPELRRWLAARGEHADYAPDLVAFEVLGRCARRDRRARQLRSRYAVHELVADLARGALPVDPPPRPTLYRFTGRGLQHADASS